MDPFKVLGVSEASVRSKEDLDKLRHRTKELYKGYLKKNREADAKKIEKAFEQIKQKIKAKDAPARKEAAPQKDQAVASAGESTVQPAAGPVSVPRAPANAAVASAPTSNADVARPRKRGGDQLNSENLKRRELIREKLVEKRKNPAVEDPETARRRELIRQRLAEKRGGSKGPTASESTNGQIASAAGQAAVAAEPQVAPAHLPTPTVLPAPTVLLKPKRSTAGIGRSTFIRSRRRKANFVICSTCGQSFERESFKFCSRDEEGFVCPTCRIRAMDPFNVVKEDRGGFLKFALVQPPLVKSDVFNEASFVFKRDFKKLKEWRKAGYNVEVRMCTLEDFETHQTWPSTFKLDVNKKRTVHIHPPKKVGQKRRDAPENLSARLRPGINEFKVSIKDHNVQRFAFALVRTRRQAARDICKQVPVWTEEQCKQRVSDFLFSSMLDGSGHEVQFSVSDRLCLTCPVSMVRMKTPARGRKCQHVQCFDLMSFMATNQRIAVFNKRWLCPVCDMALKSPKEMFIDTFVMNIVANAAEDVVEVVFDQNGDWSVSATAAPGTPSPGEEPQPMVAGSPPEEPEGDGHVVGSPPEDLDGEGNDSSPLEVVEGEASDDGYEAIGSPVDAPGSSPPEPEGSPPETALSAASPYVEGSPCPIASPSVGGGSEVESDAETAINQQLSSQAEQAAPVEAPPADFIDPMDESNYRVVELSKPMGIVFEANVPFGGVFAAAFGENSAVVKHGKLKIGDQLVGVGGNSVKGQKFDACIDSIVADPSEQTKLTVFRGKAVDLYGKWGASAGDFIEELLKRVADGQVKPAPPMEKPKSENRLSMPVLDGTVNSDDEDEGGFSDDDDSSMDIGDARLSEQISACIKGAGLDEDLQKCVRILPDIPFDGAPKRISPDAILPHSIQKVCVQRNPAGWAAVDGKKAWRKSARKRLADAANSRVDRLEALERQKQESERQARLAAMRRSQEEGGKVDLSTRLLRVEPSRLKFDNNRQAQLTLKNSTSGHVAFRIKTSAPKFILVEPTAGTVKQSSHAVVQIVSTERRNIIGSHELKFIVQAAVAPNRDLLSREKWAELEKKGSVFYSTVHGKL